MEIKDIVQKAHDNAVKHGFWDPPLPFGTAIALIHSELSEALEEERAGNRIRPGDPVPMIYYLRGANLSGKMFREYEAAAKSIRRQIDSFYSKYAGKYGLT